MIDWIKRILSKKKNNKMDVTRPKDWNLTIADLINEMSEGKRKDCGQQELEWAREYERSLIPSNYRYPLKGDLYESNIDQMIEFLTSWEAPFTGSGKSMLYKGESIWIPSDSANDKPIGVYALPVNYKDMELRMVDSIDRNSPKYSCFYLSINTKDLNENFTLIKTGFSKEKYE